MSPPTDWDLRTECLERNLCTAEEFELAIRSYRKMAASGGRMSLLDVLVVQCGLPAEYARDLRGRGFGDVVPAPASQPGAVPDHASPTAAVPSAAAAVRAQDPALPIHRPPPPMVGNVLRPTSSTGSRPGSATGAQPPRISRFGSHVPGPTAAASAEDPPRPRLLSARVAPAMPPVSSPPARPSSQPPRPASQPPRPPSQTVRPPSQTVRPASQTVRPPSQTVRPASQVGRPPSPAGRPPSQTTRPPSLPGRSPSQIGRPPSQPGRATQAGFGRASAAGLSGEPTMAWAPDVGPAGPAVRPQAPVSPGSRRGSSTGGTQAFTEADLRAALERQPSRDAIAAALAAPLPPRASPVEAEDVLGLAPAAEPPVIDEAPDILASSAPATGAPPEVPFGADLVGRTLGGCRLDREIGRGAMGVVFEATHRSLDRRVAVKVLMPSEHRRNRDVEQFFREARALARIEHQNIVQVHDVGEEGGLHFLVMQYLEGATLAERLERVRQVPWDETCRIARDVARGLSVAHDKGIVHRDIKPENLFVTADGVVKVADFGLAAQAAGDEDVSARTEVMGTPAYMSPEQIDGRSVDGRADLYSLGCTMYVMLSGRRPFDGATPIEILLKQTKEVAPPVCTLARTVPPSVSQVVEKLMAKSPSARYANAGELVADLEKVLGGGRPKVVVEIEDVMGRMQDVLRQAEAPASRDVVRPFVAVCGGVGVVVALVVAAMVLLPSVDLPALDAESLLAPPPEERAAEEEAKKALADVEAVADRLEESLETVLKRYDDLERRYGKFYVDPIRASRELTAERFDRRRDEKIGEIRAKAAPLLKSDPVAAVETLLTLPRAMRQGDAVQAWQQDLERASSALRMETGMTFVAGGRCVLGPDRRASETAPFLIDVTEVTNADYARFVEATGARAPGAWGGGLPRAAMRDLPVVGVSATEADAYAKWAGKRLPTAEEWERAARGPDGLRYPWGEEFDAARCASRRSAEPALVPVSTLTGGRAPEGAFHMAGNAAEWTSDRAAEPSLAGCREVRGGSARSHPAQCAPQARYWVAQDAVDPALLIGFRCVRDL